MLTGESLQALPGPVEQVSEEHRLSTVGNLVLAVHKALPRLLPEQIIPGFAYNNSTKE